MTEEQKHQIKDMLIQHAEENKETTYMAFKSRALCRAAAERIAELEQEIQDLRAEYKTD